MTKLTQKERRERKKQKCLEEPIVNEQSLECPICLETIDDKKIIKLDCGHLFCNDCMNELSKSEVHSKIKNDMMPVIAPLGVVKNKIPIMVFTNEEPIIKCAVCRTEHIVITNTLKPQEVLIKIEFAMNDEGLTPTHYITDYSQLLIYKPIKNYDENVWSSFLYEIIERSKHNECNTVYVCKCNCIKRDCPDIFLCNKINYDLTPNSYKYNLELMNVDELKNYVKVQKHSKVK